MAERPDDLDAVAAGRVHDRNDRREVEPVPLVDEMPADPLVGDADVHLSQPRVILLGLLDVLGRRDHVDADAATIPMGGRLEPSLPERGKEHHRLLSGFRGSTR